MNADEPNEIQFCGQMRVNLIKGWDKLLTWTLKPKMRPYLLTSPIDQKVYQQMEHSELEHFDKTYGFYSLSCPLVGVVTKEKSHVTPANLALQSLSEIPSSTQRDFARDEILCKVVAYRNLEKGMKIQTHDQVYVVDEIIDLWRGMPAFGLVPENRRGAPILLFRGTDMNLVSEKGWASILSDLDTTGPGHATFLKARDSIRSWLEKVKKQYEAARLMGYSLGGAFVFYTLVYEPELINKSELSVAYNPPGISKDLAEKWGTNPQKIPLMAYVNQGDIVSQIGFFLSDVWEIALEQQMEVIQAHLTLISAQPVYKLSSVDVERENRSRS